MTAEELLKPRFEVVADFPYSFFNVGDILIIDEGATNSFFKIKRDNDITGTFVANFQLSKYPHLFRKLNWWEYRNIEDMPKRVMSLLNNNKYEIEEWDMEAFVGWKNKKERSCIHLDMFEDKYGYIPID